MAKIKKGDLVQVITGKKQDKGGDRGKQGKVLDVLVAENRVIVEGVQKVRPGSSVKAVPFDAAKGPDAGPAAPAAVKAN